jgi:hypothetical protein
MVLLISSTVGAGSWPGFSLMNERPSRDRPRRTRVPDVEAAVGQGAVVARRDEQEAAALAAIRAREAAVHDPLEPHVVEQRERLRRRVDHHRTRREIDDADEVDRVGVRGQEQRLRPHQLREDQDRVVLHARLVEALQQRLRRRSRKAVEVGVQPVHEVEMVVHELARLAARNTIDELECPEPAVEPLRHRDGLHCLAGNRHLVLLGRRRDRCRG